MAISSGSEVVTVTERQAGGPSPGWYLDPADGRQQRFWDGSQWTPQVKRARSNRRRALLVLGGLVALFVVVFAVLSLWSRIQEDRLRPGLAKTLDAVVLPADMRRVTDFYWGNAWCFDTCLTLTRRYSSPLPREETYRVFAAELERLGYQCVRDCGQVDGDWWAQPGKGERAPELFLAVRLTTDVDRDVLEPQPKDAGRPVHADLSAR
jgi:hypothetical protein